MLLISNCMMAVVLGIICGCLFYNVTNDIAGFQNRMGLFFFLLSLFAFASLTSLQTFRPERMLFMRERQNNSYDISAYFAAKITMDLIPLRIIPPILVLIVVYPLSNLNPTIAAFFGALGVLVLFNLTSAAMVLVFAIGCGDAGLANLLSSITMLVTMLFGGLLLNKGIFEKWKVYFWW